MSTKTTPTIEVNVDTTGVTKEKATEVTVPSSRCVKNEPLPELDVIRKEYSIVGDAFYAGFNSETPPTWLTDLVNNVVDAAVDAGLTDYDLLVQDVQNAIASIDVAANTYVEQVNFTALVDGIIGTRLATLNTELDGKFATIIDLDAAVVNADSALTLRASELEASFSADITSQITTIQTAYTSADTALGNSINALTVAFTDQETDLSGVADAVTGLQTYVGLTGSNVPSGTGILSRVDILEKQADGVIEYTTNTYDVMIGVEDPNTNVDNDELVLDALPYVLWTEMTGTGAPVATVRDYMDYSLQTPATAQIAIEENTLYVRTDFTNVDIDKYYQYANSTWSSITENVYNAEKESLRASHTGDVYIQYSEAVPGTKVYERSYKFIKTAADTTPPYSTDPEGYGWAIVADTDAQAAYALALEAKDLADAKRRVFTVQPFPPYDEGDLWIDSSVTPQLLKVAITSVTGGGSFNTADWVIADEYAQDFVTNTYTPDSTQLHRQLDGKIEYFFYESYTDIGGAVDEASALNLIDDAWNTQALQDAANGNVVYFKDSKNAYWYQASTPAWLAITDTSIYEALQDAAAAQGAADGKVSHFYAWSDNTGGTAPANFTIVTTPTEYQLDADGNYVASGGGTTTTPEVDGVVVTPEVSETIYGDNVLYWFTDDGFGTLKLYRKGTSWVDKIEVPTNSGAGVYISLGDVLDVFDPIDRDVTTYVFNGTIWQTNGAEGIISKSRWFVDLDNAVYGPHGQVAVTQNLLRLESQAYADANMASVENQFSYTSTIRLGGFYYESGFGIDSSGITQTTDGLTPATAFDSEFWVNAERFVLKSPTYPQHQAVFQVTATGISLGLEYTDATRNVPRGTHDTNITYLEGDIVTSDGSSYIALQDVPTAILITNTTYWELLSARGYSGIGTNYWFKRSESPPIDTPASDGSEANGWYDSAGNVLLAGVGDLYSIEGTKAEGANTWTFGTPVVVTGQIIRELVIYSAPTTGSVNKPAASTYNFATDVLSVGANSNGWASSLSSITADQQKIYACTALVKGNDTETAVAITWSDPAVYAERQDGLTGAFTDYLFTRKTTTPADPGGADTWYTNVTSVPAGSGDLWVITATTPAGGGAATYSDKRVIDAPIVRELSIYSDVTTGTISAPTNGTSTYNFATNSLSINDASWNASIPSITANNQKVYVTTALVTGNATETSVGINWNTSTVYSHRVDGAPADALTVTANTVNGITTLSFSDGTSAVISDGTDGVSNGVKIIYSAEEGTDLSGTFDTSFTQGTRRYVNYYEWSGTAPSSPPSGLTYTLFIGQDGDNAGVIPIYADDASGTNASFTQGSREFVNFYEWTNTPPGTPPAGLTYVRYTAINYTGTIEYYKLTNSATPPTVASGGWLTTPQTPTVNNQYLWNYNENSKSDGTSVDSPVSLITQYVADGDPGNSITAVVDTYQKGSSATVPPTGTWTTFADATPLNPANPYLWNRTVISYSDTADTTTYTIIATIPPTGPGFGAIPAYSNSDYSTITYDPEEDALVLQSDSDTSIGMAYPAFNVEDGKTVQFSVSYKSDVDTSSGFYVRVYEYDDALPAGKLAVSNTATNTAVQEDTRLGSMTPSRENTAITTSYQTVEFTYTPTSTAEWASIVILNWTGMGSNKLFIKSIQRSIVGIDGVSYTGTTEYYKLTNSSTAPTIASGGWSTSPQIPTVDNQYLWNYNNNAKSDGSSTNSAVSLVTQYVTDGAPGNSITSITESYQKHSSSSSPPSTWTTFGEATPLTLAKPYLWNRTTTSYSQTADTDVYTVIATLPPRGPGYAAIPAYSNGDYDTISFDPVEEALVLYSPTDTAVGMAYPAFNVEDGKSVKFNVAYKSDVASASGLYIRVFEYDSDLPAGKYAVSTNATNPAVQEDTRQKAISPVIDDVGISTTYQSQEITYTPTSSAKWASIVFLNGTGMGISELYVKSVERNVIGSTGDIGPRGVTVGSYSIPAPGITTAPESVSSATIAGYWNSAVSATFVDEVEGDTLIVTNPNETAGWTHIFTYNGSSWTADGVFTVNGNQVVTGTLLGEALVANTVIQSPKIEYVGTTHMRVSAAEGFGSANQFIEWFGPNQLLSGNIDYSSMTEANAITYLKTDGSAYFGGAIISGELGTSRATSDLAADAEVTIGPFGSNGGAIAIAAAVTMTRTKIVQRATSVEAAPADPTCSVVLEEYTGGSWVTRQTENYVGTGYISNPYYETEPGNDGWFYTSIQTLSGSFTFTDNQNTTNDRTYRLRLTARSILFGGIDVTGIPTIYYTDTQRLSLVSSE